MSPSRNISNMNFNYDRYFDTLKTLVSNNAITDNDSGLKKNIDFIIHYLEELDFDIEIHAKEHATPVIYAHRKSVNSDFRLGMYAHYDVEPTDEQQWYTPSTVLTQKEDRIFGRGVADNLGILLMRFQAVEYMVEQQKVPEIHWLFQGQEEIQSPLAHQLFPKLDIGAVDIWLEETGYFDISTLRQRYLILNENQTTHEVLEKAKELLPEMEFTSYSEYRSLTKFDPCPFLNHILKNTAYLAIGPNDEYSNIHMPNESLSIPLIEKSYDQMVSILGM